MPNTQDRNGYVFFSDIGILCRILKSSSFFLHLKWNEKLTLVLFTLKKNTNKKHVCQFYFILFIYFYFIFFADNKIKQYDAYVIAGDSEEDQEFLHMMTESLESSSHNLRLYIRSRDGNGEFDFQKEAEIIMNG